MDCIHHLYSYHSRAKPYSVEQVVHRTLFIQAPALTVCSCQISDHQMIIKAFKMIFEVEWSGQSKLRISDIKLPFKQHHISLLGCPLRLRPSSVGLLLIILDDVQHEGNFRNCSYSHPIGHRHPCVRPGRHSPTSWWCSEPATESCHEYHHHECI